MPEKSTLATFEASLQQLGDIVEKMQAGQLPLDQSMQYFEQGIQLIRSCQKTLQQAEQKVKILSAENTLDDFDHEHKT